MNISRMLEIAELLRELYLTRTELSLREWQYAKDAEGRKAALIPAEGWPGSNKETREAAERRCYAADETLRKIDAQAGDTHVKLAQCEAMIAGLEAERRALEYTVKAGLVEALRAAYIDTGSDQDEFDVTVQEQIDTFDYASNDIPF